MNTKAKLYIPKDATVFIAGAAGMVGSAIVRKLIKLGYRNLIGSYHSHEPPAQTFTLQKNDHGLPEGLTLVKVDLASQLETQQFYNEYKPEYVFMAAARVGGINANNTYPAEFIHQNLAIQGNVIHAAYKAEIKRLLFLGSSCIYPKLACQPMREKAFLTGVLEPTNEPYAIAKIAGLKMCEAFNRQYKTRFLALMPTNLYGPNDNFDLENSHVLPALIRQFYEAKMNDQKAVLVWGSGAPRREFLHVDDMADACSFVMNLDDETVSNQFLSYPKPVFINLGTGTDCSIRELAIIIMKITEYKGELVFDGSKPDGTPQKLLDVSKLVKLGWRSTIDLEKGIKQTYEWYVKQSSHRSVTPLSQ